MPLNILCVPDRVEHGKRDNSLSLEGAKLSLSPEDQGHTPQRCSGLRDAWGPRAGRTPSRR